MRKRRDLWYTLSMQSGYEKLHKRHAEFFAKRKFGVQTLIMGERICTALFAVSYLAVILHLLIMKQMSEIIQFGLAFFACLASVQLLRFFFPRKRPFEQGITPLVEKKTAGNSFPSRHTACAFTIATIAIKVLGWFCIPLYVLGLWLAYTRFVLGWHYPSDLLGGSIVGTLCGLIVFI